MATILKIKRSSTNPTATPSGLGQGELAYGEGTSTYTDAQGATVVSHGKLFVGKGTETGGVAAGLDIIGGKYFTDLLDHGHGTITANSAAIVDSAKKVDEWNVDNITLNGNTISTTNSNGDLTIDTNGTGDVILAGSSTVGDNLFKINDGSTDRFVVDSFSGAVDISSPTLSAADTLLNISSTWNNAGATFYGIDLDVTNTSSDSSSRLLNLSVGGSDKFNVDLDGNVYLTGSISYANAVDFNIQDNTADAFVVKEGTNHYIDIDTTDAAELLTLGNDITTVDVVVEDNAASAFAVKEGSNEYIAVDTTDGSELITFGTGNVDIDNDLNIDGGDLTTNQTSFNLLNTTATTVNAFGAATTIDIGASSGTTSINNNLDVDLDLNVDGGDITTNQTTFNLINANATTVNFAGAGTDIQIGAATGTTNINNNLDVDGDVNIDGGDLTVSTTTFNLANTNATTVNAFGTASTINMGAAGGTMTVANDTVDLDGDLNVDGGDLTTNLTSFNLLNTSATTVNFAGAATTIEIGSASGTTNVNNNLDVDGDVNIDGGDLTASTTTFNLVNSTATTVNAFGDASTINMGAAGGTMTVANDTVDLDGDLNVDGGDITTSLTSFNLLNTNATTVNFAGAGTDIQIGAATGTTNINNDLDVDGDVSIDGGDLDGTTTTFNLLATPTTVNFAAAGTDIQIGSATGTTNVNNDLDVDGDVSIDGGDLDGTTSTFNLLATPTTVNFAAAGTDVQIGSSTGTTNINNDLDVDGDVNIDGGDLTVSTTTFNLANTTATTVNFAGAATAVEIGSSSGTTSVNNNLDVDGDVNVDGGDLTTNQTTFNLINTNATTVNAFGAATNLNIGNSSTEVDFGDLRIVGSTIYSDNAGAQTITIDPFPAGGDSGGNVVVRGNLQVSGTTTTVNSTQMTINDPVFTLGDSISEKTVTAAALSGQADITLDDVAGLNVGDLVSGNAAIPAGAAIQSIAGTTVTLDANLTSGISASTNTAPVTLTFTQGADDNKDRGIEFKYFNGSLKQGFFGYDESGISEDVVNYYFTYIPEATNTAQVFSGTVGKAYFDTVKLEMGTDKGIPFFDQYKRLTRTEAAGTSDATTSYQILTVNASGVPLWTTTIDGGTY